MSRHRHQSLGSLAELPAQHSARWLAMRNELLRCVAVLLPVIVLASNTGLETLGRAMLVFACVLFWQNLFAHYQQRAIGIDGLTSALLFTLLIPDGVLWWQLLLGVSFGIVVGEQLFGGRGYSFLHPVIVGLAFLLFSFSLDIPVSPQPILTTFVFIGLFLLLTTQLIDWRTVLGIAVGVALASVTITQALPTHYPEGIYLAVLVFTAADPAVTPTTRAGRWPYGVLLGSLMIIMDPALQALDAVIFSILLCQMSAPLIDWIVVRIVRATGETADV